MSETASCRPFLERFVKGDTIDLGFGGDPIVDHAILVDRNRFEKFGDDQITRDVFDLSCFENDMFDTVFSSHVLEDAVNTEAVLREWVRILAPDGHLILFLPNQMAYEEHCAAHGTLPNQDHKHKHFCFEYVVACLPACMNVIHFENPVTYNPYSFALVARKIAGMPNYTLHDVIRAKQERERQEQIQKEIADARVRVWTPDDIP